MRIIVLLFLFFLSIKGNTSQVDQRIASINKIRLAFEKQSTASSYLDSYNCAVLFNVAKSELENMKEPKSRIEAIQSLWIWYRKFGYSCGLTLHPVQCPDEYLPAQKMNLGACALSTSDTYHQLDPNQQRWLRDFLFGVGEAISGVFCIVVNPPISGRFGAGLVLSGFGLMWHSVNNMVVDRQQKELRLAELEKMKEQSQKASQK